MDRIKFFFIIIVITRLVIYLLTEYHMDTNLLDLSLYVN